MDLNDFIFKEQVLLIKDNIIQKSPENKTAVFI